MLAAMSSASNRRRSLVLLAAGVLLGAAAAVVGVNDNLPGVLLVFLAVAAFVLAAVHPWRSPGKFGMLLGGALIVFLVTGILHNFFEMLVSRLSPAGVLLILLRSLAVITFLIAVLVAPPTILIGAFGSIAMIVRRSWRAGHPGSA